MLTALPIQNTLGVRHSYSLPLKSIQEQLQAIFEDIPPDAIKIGMLFSEEIIHCVADYLELHGKHIPIILDPVMVSKNNNPLLQESAVASLKKRLIPLATLITPNLPEAIALVGQETDAMILGKKLLSLGSSAILLKGGHGEGSMSNDLYLSNTEEVYWLKSPRVISRNTHGTGCTLSAAIAAFLAEGFSLVDACWKGKEYLFHAIEKGKDYSLGKGCGPVHHFYHGETLFQSLKETLPVVVTLEGNKKC